MQRILNCHLASIFALLLFSLGCCKSSPWSIAQSNDWGPGSFQHVADPSVTPATQLVSRGESELPALGDTESPESGDDLTAPDNQFVARKSPVQDEVVQNQPEAQIESPGILSPAKMIDPAELTRQIREKREAAKTQAFQLASEWKPQETEVRNHIQQVSYEETVKEMVEAPAVVKESSSGMLAPLSPAAEVVSHPLQPILYEDSVDVASEPSVEMEYELRDLPPLNVVASPETPNEQFAPAPAVVAESAYPKTLFTEAMSTARNDSDAQKTVAWAAQPEDFPEYAPELDVEPSEHDAQQVAWFEQVLPQTDEQATDHANQVGQTIQTDEQNEAPESDKFTAGDFILAGWSDKSCDVNCPSKHVHSISSQMIEDGNEIAPVQYLQDCEQCETEKANLQQLSSEPSLPEFSFNRPPLRSESTSESLVQQPELPMLRQSGSPQLPTELPIPPNSSESDDNSFRLPLLVTPASATLPAKLDGVIAKAGFESDVDQPAPVLPVFEVPQPLTWRAQLQETATSLQGQIRRSTDANERAQLEGKLELLRLLPDELDETQQQYLGALTDLLRATGQNEPQDLYAAGQTLDKLRNAVSYMESVASMKIVNPAFCSKVLGFGQFTPTESMTFNAGQQVLVYCEIENHTAHPRVVDGASFFSTRLSGSFVVYDANQNAVQQESFPVVEDLARQRRQDFYMHIPITFGQLPAGEYTYQLMVDDVGGNKSASLTAPIEFSIR